MKVPALFKALAIMALAAMPFAQALCADETSSELQQLTLAIFPFEEHGDGVKDMGLSSSLLVFKDLSMVSSLSLVDRKDLDKILGEQGLSKSGLVGAENAVSAGQLVGAKFIVTGSVFKIGGSTNIVAKLISTETSRVFGVQASGAESLDIICQKLSKSLIEAIKVKGPGLLPPPLKQVDVVAALQKQFGDAKRPKIYLDCAERHVGQFISDPAVETEVKSVLSETGFEVVGSQAEADILIKGEGVSETTLRRNGLVAAKARVEITLTDIKTKKLIGADKQVSIGIDAAESVAAKEALQNATSRMILRLFPKLVKK